MNKSMLELQLVKMTKVQKMKKRRITKRKRILQLYTRLGIGLLVLILVVLSIMKIFRFGVFSSEAKYVEEVGREIDKNKPDIDVQLLTPNMYSRPGTNTQKIKGIVIHYTANPGSTAVQNRNYFEGLKDSHQTKASSHFVVGIKGEIVQCVPTWEEAYASNTRNKDTISIETCHKNSDGKYTRQTYKSMVQLTAWLCKKFDLTEKDVIRHYDITGKICPKYFVEDEKAWEKFKKDVRDMLR